MLKFGKICNHINKSPPKLLLNKISKRLSELEFKSNHSTKLKCLNLVVKKILSSLSDMQTHCLSCRKKHIILVLKKVITTNKTTKKLQNLLIVN